MIEHAEALAQWQAIRYGDTNASRAALAYYRERGWKVDDPHYTRDSDAIETRVYAFLAGYECAVVALAAERDAAVQRIAVLEAALREARDSVAAVAANGTVAGSVQARIDAALAPAAKGATAMTENQMRELVRLAVQAAGSQRAFARAAGVSAPFLHDVILGRRHVGPTLAAHLGYAQRVEYTRVYTRAAAEGGA